MSKHRISDIDRNRLINAYINGKDYIDLADTLSINSRSAYRIIQQFMRTGKREILPSGGAPPRKITSDILEELVSFIETKPTATLAEMKELLLRNHDLSVGISTIARHLDGALITLKLSRAVPFNWSSDLVKVERRDYAEWMMRTGVEQTLIYTDECGFNLWTARTQARSARGARAVRMVEGQRGPNLTVCLAVSPQYGLVHFTFVEGGMTKDAYSSFMSEVSSLLEDDDIVIIHDNAPSHGNLPLFYDRHDLFSLPRYSPFLNITENAISCLKSAVKRQLTSLDVQRSLSDHERATREGVTLHRLRLNILRGIIAENINVITQTKCAKWFAHSLTYMDRCRDFEDILS